MPVIAAFNPKGGCAKSTAILVAADALSRRGATVSIIDTDPQRTIAHWRAEASASKIDVVEERASTNIHRVMREASERSAFVFVDMAGFASDMRTPVVSRADLIIIPMQASYEDARRAAEALALIASDEETLGRQVEKRILWSRTVPNMISRVERRIMQEIAENDVLTLTTHLSERSAYKAMMLDKVPLDHVDANEFNGVPKAIRNADELAGELVELIISKGQPRKAGEMTGVSV